MRVLITGGAGFVGSHLVDHYLRRGDEVIVIDNLITGREENIGQHIDNKKLKFIKQDVCDVTEVKGNVDLVLHFACPASPFEYQKYPIETLRVMSFGTYNMLELARIKNAKFLLASTSEVYGDPEVHPQKEDYFGNVNLLSPRAVYDEGKRFAETLTISYFRKFNLNIGIVRIFNTYGERMHSGDGRVIPSFISEALKNKPLPIFGDGSQTRSFCYISDMVNAITKAAQIDYPMPMNLGNPAEYTILQLADIVKRLCPSQSEYEFLPLPDSDPKKRKPDISKAKKLLGWEPKIGLEQGLKKVIEWFRRKND
jgi:dTDP-glucose 4,6-dehydratase